VRPDECQYISRRLHVFALYGKLFSNSPEPDVSFAIRGKVVAEAHGKMVDKDTKYSIFYSMESCAIGSAQRRSQMCTNQYHDRTPTK
jgi:hypothetical protein